MKKKYFIIILILILGHRSWSQTTQSNFINYQGVARDGNGQLLADTALDLQLALRFGSANSAVAYEENHSVFTDANGVFSLQIGDGTATTGNYSTLPWGSAAAFISVSIDGVFLGTTEIMAVPYAISSGDGQQTAAEVPYDNTVSGLTAENAQEAIDALVGGGTINTDNQDLVLTGDVLTIEGGTGSVDLSTYIDDADADPTNELQTLSFDAASNALSLSDGNTVTIPSGGTDADADPTNEIQDITLDGAILSITGGSSLDLEPLLPPGGSDDQNLELTGDILSIEGGTGSVDLSTYIDDADADPTNELQTLSFDVGTNALSLSNGNSVILLSGGTGTSPWEQNGNAIFYDVGNVGIGLENPNAPHHVHQDAASSNSLYTTSDTGSGANNGFFVGLTNRLGDGFTGEIINQEDGPLYLGTNGLNRLRIMPDGQVGIGIFPEEALDVEGTVRSRDLAGTGQRNVVADAEGNLIIGAGGGGTDGDNDPLNEIQDIALDGAILSITNGSSLDLEPLLGSGGTDNQNLELTGDILTIEDGTGSVDLSNYIDDTDADPTNEIQDISLLGTELSISNGSTIDLAPIIPLGGSDDQNLELTGDILSIEGGTGSVDLSIYIDDADADPLNEVDVTAQTGILLGDGTDVTGLVGTMEGQVPKWDSATNSWVPGDDETATGGGGAQELNDLTDAITNTSLESLFIGNRSGERSSGATNTAVGDFALFSNIAGSNNTALGASALANNQGTSHNTAVGARTLSQNTASDNTALGSEALAFSTRGSGNTAVGRSALRLNTTGAANTAVGRSALVENNTGNLNTALGESALRENTTGESNTAVGLSALRENIDGDGNTALGHNAMRNLTSGNNNTALGENARVPNSTGSNQVRIGNTNVTLAQIQVAWAVTSDRRWKTDIQDLPYGLNMVNQLRPVDYRRKNNESQTRETGFIAQEVQTVLRQLGYNNQGVLTEDDQGYLSLRYNDFVPILTKAIQEQQNQIQALQDQNEAILAQMIELQQRFGQLLESKVPLEIKEDQNQHSKK